MKYILILIALAFTPIVTAKDSPPRRGEVVKIVPLKIGSKSTGKTTVLVWDGRKSVKVLIPNQYMRQVIERRVFPYKITRDIRTGRYVSSGRRGL
jgi:hypothetical protein